MRLSLLPALGITTVFATAYSLATAAAAGQSSTGSHLDSRVTDLDVIPFSEPDEVSNVRRLLQDGRGPEAVAAARNYLARLERDKTQEQGATYRYFALNALCGALTQVGELDEAIATCSRAIKLNPQHWSAVNNRGTAHYVSGSYEEALADYQDALTLAPEEAAETIRHNIQLSEDKLANKK